MTYPASSWYKNPVTIISISLGGFAIVVVLLVIITVIVSRKWKRRVKPVVDYPLIQDSRLEVLAEKDNSGQSTPSWDIVEDLEMENVAIALHRIKTTEQYEMKSMPRLDF